MELIMRTRTGRTVHMGTLDSATDALTLRELVHLLVANADWNYTIGDQLSIESVVPEGALSSTTADDKPTAHPDKQGSTATQIAPLISQRRRPKITASTPQARGSTVATSRRNARERQTRGMTQDDAPSQDTRRREQAIARCDRPRAPFNCTSAPRTQGIDRTKKPTPKSHCSKTPSTGVNRPEPQGSTADNRPGRQRNRGSPTKPESPTRQEAGIDRWSSTTTACDPDNAENLGSPSHVRQDGESHWRLPRRRGDRLRTTASRRRLTADSPPMGESTSPQPRSLTNVPHHPARGDQPRRPDTMETDTAPTPTPTPGHAGIDPVPDKVNNLDQPPPQRGSSRPRSSDTPQSGDRPNLNQIAKCWDRR